MFGIRLCVVCGDSSFFVTDLAERSSCSHGARGSRLRRGASRALWLCSLLDAARESFEIECFVAQVCDGTATLLLPGVDTGSAATSEAEWTRPGAQPSDVRT